MTQSQKVLQCFVIKEAVFCSVYAVIQHGAVTGHVFVRRAVAILSTGLILLGFLLSFSASDANAKTTVSDWGWSIGGYGSRVERKYRDDEETDIFVVPVTIKWRSGRKWIKLSTSWVSLEGPGNVDTDLGESLASDQQRKEGGVGDLYLSAGHFFRYSLSDRTLWFEVSSKVKAPIADEEKGLGTGEPDAKITGSLFYPLQSKRADGWLNVSQLYTKLSYQYREDPEAIDLENRPEVVLGAVASISDAWSWGAHWQWRGRSVSSSDPRQQIFLFVTKKRSAHSAGLGAEDRLLLKKVTPFMLFDAESPSREVGVGVNFTGHF